MKYHYQMTISLEASAVSVDLETWLEESLPIDYKVLHGRMQGMRVIVVVINGSSIAEVNTKRDVFMETVRAAGFNGLTIHDFKTSRNVKAKMK